MKRTRSLTGRNAGKDKGRSRSPKSPGKFSKKTGGRDSSKSFRPRSRDGEKAGFSDRSGERSDRFKTAGQKSEGRNFDRKPGRPGGRTFSSPARSDDRASRFKRDGEETGKRSYRKSSDRDERSPRSSSPRTYKTERPSGFKRDEGEEKRPYRKSSDRGERTTRPSGFKREDGTEKRPYRKSSDRGERSSRPDSPGPYNRDRSEGFKRDDDRPRRSYGESSDRSERPTREGSPRPFDRDRKPGFKRDGERPRRTSSERSERPSREGSPRPFDRDRKPGFKRDGERPRRTSTDRGERSDRPASPRPFDHDRKEGFKRDGDRPRRTSSERGERSFTGKSDRPWNRKESHTFYGDRKKKDTFPKSDDGSTRLNKFIANAGICSRREADEMIAAGVISVNGEVITQMGYKVQPDDVVKYNNETLRSERLVYILLNKPKDFITTTDDPEDRKTVMSLIAKAGKERVYPVGRLDRNTTGVLLFTNDGDLAKRLTHPSFEVHKVYQVELDRALKNTDMDIISAGVQLEDGFIKPDEIAYTTPERNVVGIELHSGKNRIVRRIFEQLGYEVKKLDRVIFAGLTKKDLPRGRWRFLTEMEVANLKMVTGKKGRVKIED